MAEYAKNQGWRPYEKALIYGAYMHAIQDLYATMVIQPSHFGYGYNVDSESALTEPILSFGSGWHEMFTETYTPNWWQIFRWNLFSGARWMRGYEYLVSRCPLEFYRVIDEYENYYGWQDQNFYPVQRFVEAARAVGLGTPTLTQERLESYLHGWAIMLFFMYGYAIDDSRVGGMFAHPNWTADSMKRFFEDIGCREIKVEWFFRELPEPVLDFLKSLFLRPAIIGAMNKAFLNLDTLVNRCPELTWEVFFENHMSFEHLRYALSPNTHEIGRKFHKYFHNLWFWNGHNENIKRVELRESYSGEVRDAEKLITLYRTSVDSGGTFLSYQMGGLDVSTLARKAGLTGGMYSVPSENYVRQPGVLFCGFKVGRDTVFSNPIIGLYGDRQEIKLIYDFVAFEPGKAKVVVKGRTASGGIWSRERILQFLRNRDSIILTAQELVNANVCTLWFEIETSDNSGNFTLMLSSKYDSAYRARAEIYNNRLYQEWFNYGVPTREQSQNPFTDPLRYWPYAIRLNIVPVYLNPPTNLSAAPKGIDRIELRWYDNSGYDEWFDIRRENLETGGLFG